MLYMGLKATFAVLLVEGGYALADRSAPRALRRAYPIVILGAAAIPLVVRESTPLLVAQAPVMVAAAAVSWRALAQRPADSTGLRIVRAGLGGLAAAWLVHATAGLAAGESTWAHYCLSLNSLVDLGVQLLLGTGLVLTLLQDTHRRLLSAEAEGAALRRALDRDEKLRALGTLVSGVAHELNNPLTVILGYAEELSAAPGAADAARIVGEQAERCRGVVRNLSALAGQSVHPWEDLAAEDLIARVVRGLPPGPRGVSVLRTGFAGLRFRADRIGMEQVFANLLLNALQASPPGGTVRLTARATPDGVEFTVSDEGPGIAAEHLPRLFEPFFTTKGPGEGTGLGLSVAHAIVRAHGGTLAAEAAPGGRGALFRLQVPRRDGASTPNAEVVARAEGAAAGAAARTLLVVDDDSAVRSVIRRQAERRGYQVTEAAAAEEALPPRLDPAAFDAIVCDVRMPGIGGAGFHDALARGAHGALERTVFVTGDLASPDAVRFSRRCRRPLVPKPIDFGALFSVLGGGALDAAAAAAE
jgi:signal transduction histidine kinase/CheY-like chemotaxis protein